MLVIFSVRTKRKAKLVFLDILVKHFEIISEKSTDWLAIAGFVGPGRKLA